MNEPVKNTYAQTSKQDNIVKPVNGFHAFQTIVAVAILLATLFSLWTPTSLFTVDESDLQLAILPPADTPTAMPSSTPSAKPRIGILVGHWGKDDGWVCEDGLREVDINLHIATLVQQELAREGYTVDLLTGKRFPPDSIPGTGTCFHSCR